MDSTQSNKTPVFFRYEGTLARFQLPPNIGGLEFEVKDVKLTITRSGINSPFAAITTAMLKPDKLARLKQHSKLFGSSTDDVQPPTDEGLLTSLTNDVYNPMLDTVRHTLELIGWRLNTDEPLKKFSGLGQSWSEDGGENWHPLPFMSQVRFEDGSGLVKIPTTLVEDIRVHMPTGQESFKLDLVHHELFAEAWSARDERPSSSLLVAICAVEVATKRAITTLCPNAGWLAEHSPSPPIVSILEDYLPLLGPFQFKDVPVRLACSTKGKDRTILDILKNGVQLRNKVVHTGAAPPNQETLEAILLACRDLIRLLDFFCGESWALEYVRRETLEKLGISESDCKGITQEKFGTFDTGPHQY